MIMYIIALSIIVLCGFAILTDYMQRIDAKIQNHIDRHKDRQ